MPDSPRIIFVDDEAHVLNGIERMLFDCDDDWDLSFALSGKEALELMEAEPYDLIVSDMRMPVMDGVQLLEIVRERFPSVIRIVLSGYSDKAMIMGLIGLTHQFLAKPCNPQLLDRKVNDALSLKRTFTEEKLQSVLTKVSVLPVLPDIYPVLVRTVQAEHPSLVEVAEIIQKDPGLSSKILQLVNSAFFGTGAPIGAVPEAVNYLGLESIQAIVISLAADEMFKDTVLQFFDSATYSNHLQSVANTAKILAQSAGMKKSEIESAYCAGMLHDIGQLLLVANMRSEYDACEQRSEQEGRPRHYFEKELFGTDHSKVGAYLLGLWGLPRPTVEAVAFHHDPWSCPEPSFGIATIVYLAERFENASVSSIGDLDFSDQESEYLKLVEIEKYLPEEFNGGVFA